MTSHELARKLLAGPDLMVIVNGYESGVNTINTIQKPCEIALNVNDKWYYGKHEILPSLNDIPEGTTKVQAIWLGRT